MFGRFAFLPYLCNRLEAQMAELVDALVSNTNAARRAGSIPALGTDFNSIPLENINFQGDFFVCPTWA